MRGPRFVVGAAVTVAVFGIGVAAFALDGAGDPSPLADPAVTTVAPPSTEPPADPTTTVPTTDPAEDGEHSTPVSTVDCPSGTTYENHGDYVSSVAHDPDRAPGDVPAAAQSESGKPLADVETTEPDATPDADVTTGEPGSVAPGHSGTAPGHTK